MNETHSYSLWGSLGLDFAGAYRQSVSPEEAIIETIRSVPLIGDRRLYSYMLGWIALHSRLVRIDRLKSLVKSESNSVRQTLLGISYWATQFDKKWGGLVKVLSDEYPRQELYTLDQLTHYGHCPYFQKAGILTRVVSFADKKKFRPLVWIAKNNFWIKNRCRVGTSARADIITAKEELGIKNAFAASKAVCCSTRSAYDVWEFLF